MIRHNLDHWPLVISISEGLQTLDGMQAFTDEWNRWLDRGELFVSLRVFADADALVHPEGGALRAKQWLQERGADVRRLTMGMASVVPPEHFERMRKMNVEKLFGVPAGTFAAHDDALAWIADSVMAARALPFDTDAVRRTLDAMIR